MNVSKEKILKYLEKVSKQNPVSGFEQAKAFSWLEEQQAISEGKFPESNFFKHELFWNEFNSNFPGVLEKEHLYFIASYFDSELKRIQKEDTLLGVLSDKAVKKQGA